AAGHVGAWTIADNAAVAAAIEAAGATRISILPPTADVDLIDAPGCHVELGKCPAAVSTGGARTRPPLGAERGDGGWGDAWRSRPGLGGARVAEGDAHLPQRRGQRLCFLGLSGAGASAKYRRQGEQQREQHVPHVLMHLGAAAVERGGV